MLISPPQPNHPQSSKLALSGRSQRTGSSGPQAVANLHGANFDKMLEVDPESCAQAFKGSSSVNYAPPVAEGKASTQGPGALAGLKVIDLTRVLGGPYCTMVLSDHGAEVIKLEPPQGSPTRRLSPFGPAAEGDGALLEADATGRAVTQAAGKILAKALAAATAAGDIVPVLLILQR